MLQYSYLILQLLVGVVNNHSLGTPFGKELSMEINVTKIPQITLRM